jgi:hypothetical protein
MPRPKTSRSKTGSPSAAAGDIVQLALPAITDANVSFQNVGTLSHEEFVAAFDDMSPKLYPDDSDVVCGRGGYANLHPGTYLLPESSRY